MTSGAPALAPMDVAGRVARLRGLLERDGHDAALITALVDIRYLTGFTGSAAVLLVAADDLVFVTDGRYGEQAGAQLDAAGVAARIEVTNTGQDRVIAAATAGRTSVAFQSDVVTVAQHRALLETWCAPGVDLVPVEALVAALRGVKDAGEIDRMRAAAAIADAALAEVGPTLADEPTEREFARALEDAMVRRGAAGPSFDTIVAAGAHSSLPHHRPGDAVVAPGDLVVVDFGALVDGYCSDMTRTAVVGEPADEQRSIWEVVAEAQAAGVARVAAGVDAAAVDAACRDRIAAAGWADAFLHSTGHGIGLEVHEAPRVAATSTATLAVDSVVTVEPGVYLPGRGGVRIEDMVLVEPDGCRVLTAAPKLLAW